MIKIENFYINLPIKERRKGKFSTLLPILLTLFLSLIPCRESVRAQEIKKEKKAAQKIEALHLSTYTSESMGGLTPSKLFVDKQHGELYVIGKNTVAILDEDGMLIHAFAIKESANALLVNKKGDIFLSYGGNEIDILNYRGEDRGKLDLSSVPDSDSIDIQSLHMGEDGNIYIGDGKLRRVIVLDSAGKFLYQFGEMGNGKGQFFNVTAITTDKERVYLLDLPLFRGSVFKKGGGEFLFTFGRMSSLLGGFNMASGIDTDGERLFVVDTNRTQIIVFDMEGTPLFEFGERSKRETGLSWPTDVKVDGKGRVYVAGGNKNVQVYEIVTEDQ